MKTIILQEPTHLSCADKDRSVTYGNRHQRILDIDGLVTWNRGQQEAQQNMLSQLMDIGTPTMALAMSLMTIPRHGLRSAHIGKLVMSN